MRKYFAGLCIALLWACGNPAPEQPAPRTSSSKEQLATAELHTPPFAVAGEAEGLLLVWYDEQGTSHIAQKRSEVPEARRAHVRVDSLEVSPEKRLDPAFVYVADLRAPSQSGSYPVRKVQREVFESAMVPAAKASDLALAQGPTSDVIIYGASWCGACKSAARHLTSKGVPFVEKDIEREPGAREEMLKKARAQGVNASGIPVIDVYGTLMGGFDPGRLDRLLASR